jgi:hypothetical protein
MNKIKMNKLGQIVGSLVAIVGSLANIVVSLSYLNYKLRHIIKWL